MTKSWVRGRDRHSLLEELIESHFIVDINSRRRKKYFFLEHCTTISIGRAFETTLFQCSKLLPLFMMDISPNFFFSSTFCVIRKVFHEFIAFLMVFSFKVTKLNWNLMKYDGNHSTIPRIIGHIPKIFFLVNSFFWINLQSVKHNHKQWKYYSTLIINSECNNCQYLIC